MPRTAAERIRGLTKEQARRLREFAEQRSGDPHLDAMKAEVVKDLVRRRLR